MATTFNLYPVESQIVCPPPFHGPKPVMLPYTQLYYPKICRKIFMPPLPPLKAKPFHAPLWTSNIRMALPIPSPSPHFLIVDNFLSKMFA